MLDAYSYCEKLVREADKDRYLSTLFVPAAKRPHVFALYAFNAKIAAVRERATEPMAGEVRLQWWRDALGGDARGGAEGNPVASALLSTLDRCALTPGRLLALIEARSFDLYNDAMSSRDAFDGYLRATTATLFEIAGTILGAVNPAVGSAADPAGKAYGIAGLLRAFPQHASRGQIFLPEDVLEEHGVPPEAILMGRSTPALAAALASFRREARVALAAAWIEIAKLPSGVRPAFLPLALIEDYLKRMERADYDPFTTPVDVPQWRRQWRLWRAA
jgi:phytoene synthase